MHRFLDASEVAHRLHVSERQVRRLAAEGQLPTIRISERTTRYRPADGSTAVVSALDETIVGAGVSTCAPM